MKDDSGISPVWERVGMFSSEEHGLVENKDGHGVRNSGQGVLGIIHLLKSMAVL